MKPIEKLAWEFRKYDSDEPNVLAQIMVDKANRELDMIRKINEIIDNVNEIMEKLK